MRQAKAGEWIDIVEHDGQIHFKLKDSNPPNFLSLKIDKENVNVEFDDGSRYTLLAGRKGTTIGQGTHGQSVGYDFRWIFTPGRRFRIVE